MMLLYLLLHVLIFHLLTAQGGPRESETAAIKSPHIPVRDTNYLIRYIEQCPDIGYYFRREPTPNGIGAGLCYLCFCQGAHKAVCWRRDNRRCNVDSFHYRSFAKRDKRISRVDQQQAATRVRRSPGFTDVFFRDASKDVYNKKMDPKKCKPYESSFSDDCPPEDWCTGCTVCDCDANGRWDCHILSFCDKKGKQKSNKSNKGDKRLGRKTQIKKTIKKRLLTTKGPSKIATNPIKHTELKKKNVKPKHVFKKPTSVKEKQLKPPIRYKRISSEGYTTKSIKMFKKNLATRNPIDLNGNKTQTVVKLHHNNTILVSPQIIKKAVRQIVQIETADMTKIKRGKPPQRSTLKSENKNTDVAKSKINFKSQSRSSEKKVNKRQMKMFSNKFKPTDKPRQRRLKRSLISENNGTYLATTASEQAKSILTRTDLTSSTFTPASSNLVVPVVKSFTEDFVIFTTSKYDEYYKYLIANDTNTTTIYLKYNQTIGERGKDETKEHKLGKNDYSYEENQNVNDIIPNVKYVLINITEASTETLPVKKDYTSKVKINATCGDTRFNNYSEYLSEIHHEDNDMKLSKRPRYYVFREKFLPISLRKSKNILRLKVNKSVDVQDFKNKVNRKDINRISVTKKHDIVKIGNRFNGIFLKNLLYSDNETNDITRMKSDWQDVLVGLSKEYKHNNTKKFRKFSVIKYLNKLFTSMFRRQNDTVRFNRNHIIEALCKNIGPCRLDNKDKMLLQSKLEKLNYEIISILNTVKIIKGLLRLLDSPVSSNKELPNGESFLNDMHKLNNILIDNYGNFNNCLTETQITQINYVKKNTADFVKSVSKLAVLLNQVVIILTHRDVTFNRHINKASKTHFIRKSPLEKLKYLLTKYNLIQNSFMKNMYEILNSFDNTTYNKQKVSAVQDLDSSIGVENYSRNILNNLRKLKNLSQTLKSIHRTKREIRDDDAMEYLLLLMEYLLKYNHPLDTAPANDGIDLLIDAIKDAPDIKTVRKKVLNNTSFKLKTTTTAISEYLTDKSTNKSFSYSESSHDDNEDLSIVNTEIFTNPENDSKSGGNRDIFEIINDDKEPEEKFQFDRRAETSAEFPRDVTSDVIASNIAMKENRPTTMRNDYETATDLPSNMPNYYNGQIIDSINVANMDKVYIYDVNKEHSVTDSSNIYNEYLADTKLVTNSNNDDGNRYIFNDLTETTYNINDNTENFSDNPLNTIKSLSTTTTNDKNTHTLFLIQDSAIVVTDSTPSKFLQQKRYQNIDETVMKKFEAVYSDDLEKERIDFNPETTTESQISKNEIYLKQPIESKMDQVKTLELLNSDSLDKQSKLEWIEENFGRENVFHADKNEKIGQSVSKIIKMTPSGTETLGKKQHAVKLDISSISTEVINSNKNITPSAEELMLKKQMDLLNSLDYGTEKGEFDETASKDGNTEERYSDTFATFY